MIVSPPQKPIKGIKRVKRDERKHTIQIECEDLSTYFQIENKVNELLLKHQDFEKLLETIKHM